MPDPVARLTAALQGRYRVERKLGEGGMATVYLADDLRHDRKVALKVLKPELAAVVGAERFLTEIKTTAKLQHPHILPLFDSGEADKLLFYVMPHVEGESLRERLDREHQLPVEEAVRIATNVAEALDYAHSHGVVHRDIKPANILLQSGKPVISDFGIALAVSAGGAGRLTETGLSLGTPHYMSPEQATGEQTVGPATDIWALGCVLYEMLVGEPPYTGSTPQAVLGKIITAEAASATEARKSVPANVDAAIQKALEKVPADRFGSAQDFGRALADPRFGPTPRSGGVADTALPAWRRRSFANWQAAALLIGAAAVGVLTGVRQGGSDAALRGPIVSSLLPPEGQDFSEAESFGALSPDGTRFAFVALGRRGERQLWIRALDDPSARALRGTEEASAPFWSPDGREIAFTSQGWLQVIDVAGGVVRRICAIPDAYSGSWGEASVIVVAARAGIVRVDLAGSTCRVAIAAQSAFDMRKPTLLPDGRHVLFRLRQRQLQVAVGDLEDGDVTMLLPNASDPTFVAPNLLVFVRGGIEGGGRLWAQSFDPARLTLQGDPVQLSDPVRTAQGVASYSVSPGGILVYQPGLGDRGYLLTNRAGEIIDTLSAPGAWTLQWGTTGRYVGLTGSGDRAIAIYDLERGLSTPISSSSTGWMPSSSPTWSPGDSLLAYAACDSMLACGVGLTRLDDGSDELLVAPDEGYTVFPSSWSPDLRFLVFGRSPSYLPTGAELWAYDRLEGRAAPLFDQPQRFSALEGAISPDGRWLAYRSDEAGTWEVFVRPFRESGSSQRVSTNGGRSPRWRTDGLELFFQSPDGQVIAVEVLSGPEIAFSPPVVLFAAPSWSRHNFFDIGTSYDVSPDGQRFALRMTPTGTSATLVQDWKAMLR